MLCIWFWWNQHNKKPTCYNKQSTVCVCVCLCVRNHYKIKNCWKRNYGKINSNVSDFLSPIRLHNILGTLAGVRARVSWWGRTSDSKYNFLIISHFNFKSCTYQIDCFKWEKNSWFSESFMVTANIFYLYYDMQSVRSVQSCMALLYEPANLCCMYIKNIILCVKII